MTKSFSPLQFWLQKEDVDRFRAEAKKFKSNAEAFRCMLSHFVECENKEVAA